MVHTKKAVNSNSPVIIRSYSGDTDILIMAVTSFYLTSLIIDTGTGARKKIVQEERLYVNIE